MMTFEGVPSDDLPDVLATGRGDARFAYVSLSPRHPEGRDAEYLEWHSLDHRPDQYRLAALRHSLRLVSTPACRNARAASTEAFDATDHVMTYLFSGAEAMAPFVALGGALMAGGRMRQVRVPYVGAMVAQVAGKIAAPRAACGADVIPWRPALGVYLIIEQGHASPEALVEVAGVAGAWWYHGDAGPGPHGLEGRGRQITYCYLDDDPVEAAARLRGPLQARWASSGVQPLLAAPFFTVVPFEWTRHLP
jgi:hypothetical protein